MAQVQLPSHLMWTPSPRRMVRERSFCPSPLVQLSDMQIGLIWWPGVRGIWKRGCAELLRPLNQVNTIPGGGDKEGQSRRGQRGQV